MTIYHSFVCRTKQNLSTRVWSEALVEPDLEFHVCVESVRGGVKWIGHWTVAACLIRISTIVECTQNEHSPHPCASRPASRGRERARLGPVGLRLADWVHGAG